MSRREWHRVEVIRRVAADKLTLVSAAQLLGCSVRQARRILRRYESDGERGVLHRLRGRRPNNATPRRLRERIVRLRRREYEGFNDTHFVEKLRAEHGIVVGRETVRRILREAGLGSPRKRRPRRHRSRRERKAQRGAMILWDGSRHDWLEGRGPMLCLMAAIDDATGEIMPGAHFVEQECAAGYLRVLRATVRAFGVPISAYGDRHGALSRNDSQWTLEEELRGEQDPTQVGRALQTLGIEQIKALTPQAKGRVERLWGTLQDRLASELRRAKASTREEADAVLARYVPEHNARFSVPARETQSAWRSVPREVDIERVCSFFYKRTVLNDNTVRLSDVIIDVPPGPHRSSFAQARVEVRQLLDGSWRVYRGEQLIATRTAAGALGDVRAIHDRKRSRAANAFRRAVMKV